MLTFRCKFREAQFIVEHQGETLQICAVRQDVRRNAPIEVQIRGPESFHDAEVFREGEKWCRVAHAGSECWFRVFYPAASTSDRFFVLFDALREEWGIEFIRPVVTNRT